MRRFASLVSLTLLPLALTGCPSENPSPFGSGGTTDSGGVQGSLTAPDGQLAISGAEVRVFADEDEDGVADSDAVLASTTTDIDGTWAFEELESGTYVAVATRGHHTHTFAFGFLPGNRATIPEESLPGDEVAIVQITGSCDSPSSVYEAMGFDVESLANTGSEWRDLLTNANDIDSVEVLLIPCGLPDDWVPQAPTVNSVVGGWLADGGALYVSGNSWPILEAIDPDIIDFLRDDTDFDAPQVGFGATLTASILDTDLAAHFSGDTASIRLPDEWTVMAGVGDDARVLLNANAQTIDFESVQGAPLLVTSEPDSRGPITYSSFGKTGESNADMERALQQVLLSL